MAVETTEGPGLGGAQTNSSSSPSSSPSDAVPSDSNGLDIDPSLQAGTSESQHPIPSSEHPASTTQLDHIPPQELDPQSYAEKNQQGPPHLQYPHTPPLPIPHHPHHPPFYLYPDPSGQGVHHTPHPYYGSIPIPYDAEALRVAAAISSVNGHMNTDPGNPAGPSGDPTHGQADLMHAAQLEAQDEEGPPLPEDSQPTVGSGSRQKIHRVFMACVHCKRRKSKCDGERPSCTPCNRMGIVCEYAAERRMRGPNKNKRVPGQSREGRGLKKSKAHIAPDQEEERLVEAELGVSRDQVQQHQFILAEHFQQMVSVPPPYDLSAIQHDGSGGPSGAHAHLLDPATYQAQAAAAVHAHMLMNAQAAAAAAAAAAVAAGNPVPAVYGSEPPSPSRSGQPASNNHTFVSPASIPPPPPPNVPLILPCNRIPAHPYVLPPHVLSTPELFTSREAFQEIVDHYLGSLSRKAADKALLPQLTYNAILALLLEREVPVESAEAEPTVVTPLFKFWVRKSFHLGKMDGEDVVMHNAKPVAVREQLYDVLVCCHAATRHGGRDKTCGMVNEHYSWVPKAFVEAFVKSCPGCPRRKKHDVTNPGEANAQTEDQSTINIAVDPIPSASGEGHQNAEMSGEVNRDRDAVDHQDSQPLALVDGPIIAPAPPPAGTGQSHNQPRSFEIGHPGGLQIGARHSPIDPEPVSSPSTSRMTDRSSKKRTHHQSSGRKAKVPRTAQDATLSTDDKMAETALMELAGGSSSAATT